MKQMCESLDKQLCTMDSGISYLRFRRIRDLVDNKLYNKPGARFPGEKQYGMDGLMDGQMDRRTDGQMDGRTNQRSEL
jgi:hypothetical protein